MSRDHSNPPRAVAHHRLSTPRQEDSAERQQNRVTPATSGAASVRAVAYYRMSSLRQEDSIERQQSQVIPLAQRNDYRLVGDYTDEGISGNEIERRPAFQRLLRDAQRGLFEVILCDDKDRFGRFDSLELGEIAGPLRRKGVRLETVAQGRIEWNSFAGRITDAVLQEAKKMESQAISRRVLTQMLLRARRGDYCGAVAPYGYALAVERDAGGKVLRRRLVLGDAHEVEVVRWIFEKVARRGWSIGDVHAELNRRGTRPPPRGKGRSQAAGRWNRSSIRRILSNRAYVGDVVFNQLPQGKYSEMAGGRVQTSDVARRGSRRSEESDWVVVPDAHPAIIDRDTFAAAAAARARNRARTCPKGRGEGRFVFTGMLTCGHCGARMSGRTQYGKRKYYCSTSGRLSPDACAFRSVREGSLIGEVMKALQEQFLNPENLAALREEIRRQDEEATRPDGEVDRLRKRLAQLQRDVARANDTLLLLPPERLPGAAEALGRLEAERDSAAAGLAALEGGTRHRDALAAIDAAERQLWRLREAVESANPDEVRDALGQIIERVELHFGEVRQAGGRVRRPLERGVIYLRQGGDDVIHLRPGGNDLGNSPSGPEDTNLGRLTGRGGGSERGSWSGP